MNTEMLVGQQVDQYRIVRHIARGGMADVYLATDTDLKRKVALKVMLDILAIDTQYVQRFRREAQMVAQLNHPNIVQVYAVGFMPAEAGGTQRPYIAMQFIEGGSLREKLQELAERGKLLTTEQALNIVRQVALALSVAHKANIIHRDLKPANVLIQPDGTPVLVDLGIAVAGDSPKLTQTGAIIGTPHYMSPEQVREQPLDGRSDLYSLGIILYEMLAGIRPFAANESIAILHQHVYDEPPPLSKRRPDLSSQVLSIVEICLKKEPSARFQNADELVRAIDLALQSEGIHGPNPQATQVLTELRDSGLLSRRKVVRLATGEHRRTLPVPLWAIVTFLALVVAVALLFILRPFTSPSSPTETAVVEATPIEPTQTTVPNDTATPEAAVVESVAEASPTPMLATDVPPTNTAVPPTAPPRPSQIVFQSDRDGDYEIFIMNSDGTGQRPLTNNSSDDNFPVVSADGTQVLFQSNRDGNWELYVMNSDGSQQRRLTNTPDSTERLATWSPDGQQIAFVSDRDDDFDIYTMNVDGSNLRQVTFNDLREGHVSWSVDNRLVYNSGTSASATWEIYTIDPDGRNQQQLTNNGISDWSPEWSPDGRFILYLSIVNGDDPALFVMNADGSNPRMLYNSPYYDWGADWTADGSQILFTNDKDNLGNLYIINADGSNIQYLTSRGSYPSWVK
jgi:eukaryotic-like serine/threonine-protein kinase